MISHGLKRLRRSLRQAVSAAVSTLFPERCTMCGRRLGTQERCVCAACYARLPFTRFRGRKGNPAERIFWWRVPIVRASALLRYQPGTRSSRIILDMKYRNKPQTGIHFGRIMAADLSDSGFFEGIDAIIPVPLSRQRERQRGYNQSLMLARGISQITGLPVWENVVERIVDNPRQARLHSTERTENVKGIFRLHDKNKICGRHVLIVDDVLTTGATALSLAGEICQGQGTRISVLALALAGTHSTGAAPARPFSDART